MPRALRMIAAFAMLTLTMGVACGGGGSKSKTNAPASSVTAAAGAVVSPTVAPPVDSAGALGAFAQQQLNKSYAGDCGQSNLQPDPGKVCSVAKGQRDNLSAFQIQPIGAQPTSWVILQSQGAAVTLANSLPITPDNSAVPGVPWPLRTGVDLVVAGGDPCINVHTDPSIKSGNAVDCIKDGTKIRLIAGPIAADNYQWWQVEGRTGWVVSDFLRYPDAAQ